MAVALLMCTVLYDGSKQPEHLQKVYRFKGRVFETGVEQEVPAELAGWLVATAPEGTVKVVKGEPAPYTPMSTSQRAALRKVEDVTRSFSHDPASVLEAFKPLPAAILKLTVADVDAGKADRHLGNLAVWARLGGNTDLAKACMRRGKAAG